MRISALGLTWVLGGSLGLWPSAVVAQGSIGTRTEVLEGANHALGQDLFLTFDQKLTLILPDKVRLVVPGSPDVIVAHVSGNVVALSLVDSEFVRVSRPTTNVTVLTESGTVVTGRISVAERPEDADVDVVRLQAPEGDRPGLADDAVQLVDEWLSTPPENLERALATRLDRLRALVRRHTQQELAIWVAQGGLEAVEESQRTKRAFIYLSSHGLARLGTRYVAHLTVTNHTQPVFRVGRVRLRDGRDWFPAAAVIWAISDEVVLPDGRPRGIGVTFQVDELVQWPLAAEVCEAGGDRAPSKRCVTVEITR